MRRARDNGLLKNDNGHLIGINLGADFTAEHEWGIKRLREAFGITDAEYLGLKKLYGLERRIMRKQPTLYSWQENGGVPAVHFIEKKNETILLVGVEVGEKYDSQRYELSHWDKKDEKLMTSWDEKSFGISARSKEDRLAVKAIYEAIQNNDLALWVGGGGVFQNGGLVLAIASRLPKEKVDMLREADLDREALEKAAKNTGIADKLEKAGKRYFALSPRWVEEFHDKKTAHKVLFWLNPMEQRIHNYGIFTVEELELWADNQGPVMMIRSKANG